MKEHTSTRAPRKAVLKQPYEKPRLTVYGDLREITKHKGSDRTDGAGEPSTKK